MVAVHFPILGCYFGEPWEAAAECLDDYYFAAHSRPAESHIVVPADFLLALAGRAGNCPLDPLAEFVGRTLACVHLGATVEEEPSGRSDFVGATVFSGERVPVTENRTTAETMVCCC